MDESIYSRDFIREIQNMLRIIGRSIGDELLIIPETGMFDMKTARALDRFKSLYSLTVNNHIDQQIYDKIREVYQNETFRRGKTAPIRPYPETESYELSTGEVSELTFILQLMLNAVSLYYEIPRIPVTGTFDTETERAVKLFQRVNGIQDTGRVDRKTWERLAEEYNETVNDSQ